MHTRCSSTLVFLLLSYVLFAQTASLPSTVSFSNETLLGLPSVNVSDIAAPTTGVAPFSVTSRKIVLAFVAKGQPIPEDEVKHTLVDADQAIADIARHHPTQRIFNDRFEYRRRNGNMLISIQANLGEEITWMELNRVLQGLYRFMTAGVGTEETHYQALEFEIEASGQEKPNIGYGVVWYFNPTKVEVQKRVTLPLPISSVNERSLRPLNLTIQQPYTKTLPRLLNISLSSLGSGNIQETIIFPIPRTDLSLSFYFFGPSIPRESVKAALQGAVAKVRPYLNDESETNPIDNDAFRYVLPLSSEAGIPVAVTVLTYHHQKITWRQLFDILFGLYSFTTTFGTDLRETHYQVLGFRIVDLYLRVLGVGTISYFRSRSDQLGKRVEATEEGRRVESRPLLYVQSKSSKVEKRALLANDTNLQLPTQTSVSHPSLTGLAMFIPYPIPGTPITLTFNNFEARIPSIYVDAAFTSALRIIQNHVAYQADTPIPNDRWESRGAGSKVWITVIAYHGNKISWLDLRFVVAAVLRFMTEAGEYRSRELGFFIDKAGGIETGYGSVAYFPDGDVVVERGK